MIVCALLISCKKDKYLPDFSNFNEIGLMQKGNEVFVYDPLVHQMGFNRGQGQFRVHTDNMSDYVVVDLESIPSEIGQEVEGTLIWTTSSDIFTKRNITLETIKIEGDKIWLWHSQSQIGVVVRVLE